MKGVIFIAFNKMVEDHVGIDTWERLLNEVIPKSDSIYTSVESNLIVSCLIWWRPHQKLLTTLCMHINEPIMENKNYRAAYERQKLARSWEENQPKIFIESCMNRINLWKIVMKK
jgi:hypothetical protein